MDQIRTIDDVVSVAFGPWRSSMLVLGLFAGLAVLLSAIGIYGAISYTETQRTHEIGIRVAMGAGRGDVLRLVMKSGLLLVAVAISSRAAYWLTRLVANQALPGHSNRSPDIRERGAGAARGPVGLVASKLSRRLC